MMGLSQKDYRTILEFLKDINHLQAFDEFCNTLLNGLPRIVAGDAVTCFESCLAPENQVFCFSDPQMAAMFPVFNRVCNDHPGWGYLLSSGGSSWVSVSDFLSETAYRRTALYNECWRSWSIEDNLGTLSMISPTTIVAFSINRDRRSFKERDRQALSLLRPHLIQAWCNARQFAGLSEQINNFAATLENNGQGIVILDGNWRVRQMTAKARCYTGKYFGALQADDRLPRELHEWVNPPQSSQRVTLETAPRRPWIIEHADGSELTVTCMPGSNGVTLILKERPAAGNLAVLGLSARESEVLLWVTRGKSNEEIRSILGISPGTVKKHLEHIFQKLGVESRTAAAARALTEMDA
jgi:DNA-binding CsgD family transcriptional regulator